MLNTTKNTTGRITVRWADPRFASTDRHLATLIGSNTFKLKIENLEVGRQYYWAIKSQPTLANELGVSTGKFTQGEVFAGNNQLIGVIDGINTVFEVDGEPFLNFTDVYKNDPDKENPLVENVDYTVDGKEITFAVAPIVGDELEVGYLVNKTETNLDVKLIASKYTVGSFYFFGLRENPGDEYLQFKFDISQNVVLADGAEFVV